MDFIKKHLEKFLLAAALLALIGVAGLLAWKVEKLSEFVNAGLSGPSRKLPLKPTPTGAYSNAIAGLTSPTLWQTNSADPFHTDIEVIRPTQGLTQIVAQAKVLTKPFTLDRITRQQCKYVFKSYIGQGEHFAINDGRRTFIVAKVGGKIWSPTPPVYDTGFVVTKFEKKEVFVEKPGIPGKSARDVSELTIQRGTEPPLVLPLNQIIDEREPAALIICMADNQNQSVRKGQSILCGGRIYNVVDITLRQVIIVDEQTKEKLTISKE